MRYIGGVLFVKARGLSQNGKARNGMGVESENNSWLLMLVVNLLSHLVVNNKKACKSMTCRLKA